MSGSPNGIPYPKNQEKAETQVQLDDLHTLDKCDEVADRIRTIIYNIRCRAIHPLHVVK